MGDLSETNALDLIQSFHAAALDVTSWRQVLDEIVSAFGCVSASLELVDLNAGTVQTNETLALPDNLLAHYTERIFSINPRIAMAQRAPLGVVCSDADLPPPDRDTNEFLDWLGKTPARWVLGGRVLETPTSMGFIALHFSVTQGPVTNRQRAFGQLLMPHLVQSLAMSQRLADISSLADGFDQAVRGRGSAIATLDAKGQLQHTCPVFDDLLRQRKLILSAGRQLVAPDRNDQVRLRAALAIAIAASEAAQPILPVILHNEWARAEYIVRFMRVPRRDGIQLSGSSAVIITVDSLDGTSRIESGQLATLFGLTNREAEVATAVAGGYTVAQAAQVLAISPHTVRQHLATVFHKTGTSRQAELVALLKAVG